MNPELLKKCLSGNASEEELKIYENWIEGGDDDFDAEEITAENIPSQQDAWSKIKAQNLKHDYSQLYKNRIFKMAVAASLVAIFYFFGFQDKWISEKQMVFHYDHSRPSMEKEFDGLRIRLGHNGMVRLAQQSDDLTDISFSGNMMLSNTTSADKELIVLSKDREGQTRSKKINLRKGRSYLLAHYLFREDELVMVENHNLINMPPALAINMKRDFNL
ncbi:hypothetical protein TH53_17200 [Pedobacter lusitanus]|uniref:Uncharacterized protein n=1 Tax=Pedobacter lusitanus TaxID=1503925 RepID=A0A0D0GNI8_9SPHI|nr:hypothetical protein [Pedobacter lusitanus]KIO76066.1 hypothetical protein TH53_17200 [Pedobacter lusitanus]